MRLRLALCFLVAAGAVFASADQPTFFELSSSSGTSSMTTVEDLLIARSHPLFETTANNFRSYSPSGESQLNFTCTVDLADPTFDEWLKTVLAGKTDRKSGSVIYLDRSSGEALRYNFFEAWPCRWKAPELNAQSGGRIIGGFELEVCAAWGGKKGYDRYKELAQSSKTQKKWLCSNFRLRIEGLEAACKNVAHIDAIAVKQRSLGDLDGDGQGDYECSDLVFTVPQEDAPALEAWFEEGGKARTATIDYLTADGVAVRTLESKACVYRLGWKPDGTVVVSCAQGAVKSRSNIQNN